MRLLIFVLCIPLLPSLLQAQSEDLETRYIPSPEEIARRGISEIRLKVIERKGKKLEGDSYYSHIYRFDRCGRMIRATIPEYPWVAFAYDSLGRITRASVNGIIGEGANKGDTVSMSSYYHYDAAGNMVKEMSDYSRTSTIHQYDPETGRRIATFAEEARDTTFYQYGADGLLLKKLHYRFDSEPEFRFPEDGKGGIDSTSLSASRQDGPLRTDIRNERSLVYGSIYRYDEDGLLQCEFDVDGWGMHDSAVSYVTTYSYNASGRLVGETQMAANQRCDTMSAYRYEWDESGHLSMAMEHHPSIKTGETWMQLEYEYFPE